MEKISATFAHGNREVIATITGTEAWEKAGMSRVYIDLSFSGAKLLPIDKLYEVLAGGTKDATIEVHGRTFGYQLGISCDSKTKRTAAIEAIKAMLDAFAPPVPQELVAVTGGDASELKEQIMEKTQVAIEVDGEIATGVVESGVAAVGETVTVELHDENGMPVQQTGVVVEVL